MSLAILIGPNYNAVLQRCYVFTAGGQYMEDWNALVNIYSYVCIRLIVQLHIHVTIKPFLA